MFSVETEYKIYGIIIMNNFYNSVEKSEVEHGYNNSWYRNNYNYSVGWFHCWNDASNLNDAANAIETRENQHNKHKQSIIWRFL